jgi:lambda repressor-like predicted transcriptional regulator
MNTQTLPITAGLGLDVSRIAARVLHAYAECGSAIQDVIRDSAALAMDPEADEDDRVMALHTLHDALFPRYSLRDGFLGEDLVSLDGDAKGDDREAVDSMDREEATFAARLSRTMKDRGMTQAQLASLIGVHQSAVSMMLARKGRPQRKTVERVAEALGVAPEELWPMTARHS